MPPSVPLVATTLVCSEVLRAGSTARQEPRRNLPVFLAMLSPVRQWSYHRIAYAKPGCFIAWRLVPVRSYSTVGTRAAHAVTYGWHCSQAASVLWLFLRIVGTGSFRPLSRPGCCPIAMARLSHSQCKLGWCPGLTVRCSGARRTVGWFLFVFVAAPAERWR